MSMREIVSRMSSSLFLSASSSAIRRAFLPSSMRTRSAAAAASTAVSRFSSSSSNSRIRPSLLTISLLCVAFRQSNAARNPIPAVIRLHITNGQGLSTANGITATHDPLTFPQIAIAMLYATVPTTPPPTQSGILSLTPLIPTASAFVISHTRHFFERYT